MKIIHCKYCDKYEEEHIIINKDRSASYGFSNNWIILDVNEFICEECYNELVEYKRLKYKFKDQ